MVFVPICDCEVNLRSCRNLRLTEAHWLDNRSDSNKIVVLTESAKDLLFAMQSVFLTHGAVECCNTFIDMCSSVIGVAEEVRLISSQGSNTNRLQHPIHPVKPSAGQPVENPGKKDD